MTKTVFETKNDRVMVTMVTEKGRTTTLHFLSVEQILTFTERLMDKAVKVWPENPWCKEYVNDVQQVDASVISLPEPEDTLLLGLHDRDQNPD